MTFLRWFDLIASSSALALALWAVFWQSRENRAVRSEVPETGAFSPQPGEHENVRIARSRAKFMLQLHDEFRLRGASTQDAFEMARSWMRAGEEADLLKPQGLKGRE